MTARHSLLLAGLSLTALWAGACAPPVSGTPEPRPEVVLHGVTLHAYQQNVTAAVGKAKRLAYERGSSNAEVTDGALTLPARVRPDGQRSSLGDVEIRAPHAEGNLVSQRMEAWGGVRVKTSSGVWATTDRATFQGGAMEASGSGPVVVHGPSYALEAVGFTLRSADEEFDFGGPLRSGLGKARP